MQENGETKELFQKYCATLGGYATLVADGQRQKCLCAHLCHGQSCENKNFNAVSRIYSGVDINEK